MGNPLILVLRVIFFVFLARALISWFPIGHDSPFRPVVDVLYRVTEPVLAPIRRVLPPLGGFDLSIIVVMVAINFVLIPIARSLL